MVAHAVGGFVGQGKDHAVGPDNFLADQELALALVAELSLSLVAGNSATQPGFLDDQEGQSRKKERSNKSWIEGAWLMCLCRAKSTPPRALARLQINLAGHGRACFVFGQILERNDRARTGSTIVALKSLTSRFGI